MCEFQSWIRCSDDEAIVRQRGSRAMIIDLNVTWLDFTELKYIVTKLSLPEDKLVKEGRC